MKYVVVAGYYSDTDRFEQCIGVFDTAREAYGEALLYLQEEVDNEERDIRSKLTISPLFELEGQTGYGMVLQGVPYDCTDYANVLFWDDSDTEANHHPNYKR